MPGKGKSKLGFFEEFYTVKRGAGIPARLDPALKWRCSGRQATTLAANNPRGGTDRRRQRRPRNNRRLRSQAVALIQFKERAFQAA